MNHTSYKVQVYRFELVRDERGKYRTRRKSKSRDRLQFKHERPRLSLQKQNEIMQGIQQALALGTEVNLMLFGYFQNEQMTGQILKYEEEMQIVLIRTTERTEWIDARDIIELDLDV